MVRGGDDGARPVDALQRAIGGGLLAGEVVQSEWLQEDEDEQWVVCETFDGDGVRRGRQERQLSEMHRSKEGGLATKLFLEEGKTTTQAAVHRSKTDPAVTVEPGTCMVFDPNTTNAYIMDGDSNNANAIWLRNWREVGLENAMKTGGWCIQVLVAGGPSEMQRAEESMAEE